MEVLEQCKYIGYEISLTSNLTDIFTVEEELLFSVCLCIYVVTT